MLNLVPRLISLNFSDGNLSGSFSGSVLVFDVSGFTSMTEALSGQGHGGAETLSKALNCIYTRKILSVIRGNGGFISGFSGDSFAVISPGVTLGRAEIFGNELLERLSFTSASSPAGIAFKAGGSEGQINWKIFGRERKGWFFSGAAMRRAFLALGKTEPGGLAVCREDEASVEIGTFDRMGGRAPNRIHETAFFSGKLLDSKPSGEFRRVFSAFLAPVDTDEENEELISAVAPVVIQSSEQTGGFFNGVHYDSRGFYFLVLFGAPEAHENDLERVLAFARQIRSSAPCPIRVSISSGIVYAGSVGFQQMCTYTVLGSQVNRAARIMRFEETPGIFVSDRIAAMIPGSHTAVSASVKGIDDEVSIFRLDHEKFDLVGSPFEYRLLGRDDELQTVIGLARDSQDCSGIKVLMVSAPAGAGKSHLLWEAGNILETRGFRRIHLRCDDIIRRSFGPFIIFLRNFFQQKREMSAEENRTIFKRLFRKICEDIGKRNTGRAGELKRTVSFISSLLGIDIPDSLYHQIGADGRLENTIIALREFFLGLAQLEPLLLVVDDIQWLDDSSESLVRSITRSTDDLPLVLALAARTRDDGTRIEIPSEKQPAIIDLGPLRRQTLPDLVKDILGGSPGSDLEKFLAVNSQMNPFYLHQYVAYLSESNAIREQNGIVVLSSSPNEIPRGIVDLLTARIDRLTNDLKEIVETASVLGYEFNAKVLSAMLSGRELALLLSSGAEEKIWASVSKIIYIFNHALLRETVYNMQLKSELVKLHSRAACAIESIYPGDEEFFPDLAYHWDKAEDSETTCFYLDKVLQAASRNGDVKTAYKCVVRLKELLKTLPGKKDQLIGIMIREIRILGVFARCREAVELAERTEDLALSTGDRKRYAQAMGMRAWLFMRLGDLKTALEVNEKALEIHNELGYLRGIYESTGYLAAIKFRTGHISEARKLFERQLKVLEEMKDDGESNAMVYNNMASTAVDPAEKQQILEKAISIAKQNKDRRLHSVSLGNLAEVFHKKNQFDKADKAYNEALSIAREIGDRYYISYHSCGLAILEIDKGNYSSAEKMLQEYYETSVDTGIRYGEAEALGYMAVAVMRNDEPERALSLFDRAMLILRELRYDHYISLFQADRARTLYLLDRLDEAEVAALESNSLIEKQEKSEAITENDSLLLRIRFDNAVTPEEKLDCIQRVKEVIRKAEDTVGMAVPIHDLLQMARALGNDAPGSLSPTALKKEFLKFLDRAVEEKPTQDIISIRNELRDEDTCRRLKLETY